MIRYRSYVIIAAVFLAGVQIISLIYYVREQNALSAYLARVVNTSLPPSEQVKEIVASLKDKPDDGNNEYFLVPVFRFLRPTPWQVLERGGDCADRSRIVVALLRLRGIHASKWALYNSQGESKHAVVQVDVESGKMVLDPLFGMWFPKPGGGYYAIPELKRDPNILRQRIAELRAQGIQPGTDRLDFYPLDQYVYSSARTINWSKNIIARTLYRTLAGLAGDRVNSLERPGFVEEPPLMVIYGILFFEIFLLLTWLLLRRHSSRRS